MSAAARSHVSRAPLRINSSLISQRGEVGWDHVLSQATCLPRDSSLWKKPSSNKEKIKPTLSLPAGVQVVLSEVSLAVVCALVLRSACQLHSWCCRAYEDL